MDINYELYKVFYYVATSLSFSEASKKLFISQSAVSQSIKTLEKKLGQTLFIRSTKKVQLTAAGALLLKHIEPAMNLIARGESQLLDSGTNAIPSPILARSMSRSLLLSSISGIRSSWCCKNRLCRNSLVVLFRSSIMIGYLLSSEKAISCLRSLK